MSMALFFSLFIVFSHGYLGFFVMGSCQTTSSALTTWFIKYLVSRRLLTKRGKEKETDDRLSAVRLWSPFAYLLILTDTFLAIPRENCYDVGLHPLCPMSDKFTLPGSYQICYNPSTTTANRVRELKLPRAPTDSPELVDDPTLTLLRVQSLGTNFVLSTLKRWRLRIRHGLRYVIPGACAIYTAQSLSTCSKFHHQSHFA